MKYLIFIEFTIQLIFWGIIIYFLMKGFSKLIADIKKDDRYDR